MNESIEQSPRAWCAANGVTLSAVLRSDPADYKNASKWKCTIKRGRGSFDFDFTTGSAHRRRKPNLRLSSVRMRSEYGRAPSQKDFDRAFARRFGSRIVTIYDDEILRTCTEPDPPSVGGALWCLAVDASSVRHGQTFEEFCSDIGYDSDSRTAERMFNECRDTWAALIRLGFDLDELDRVFREDY